jgi:hypothetical protein
MKKYYIFLLMTIGLVACKKDSSDYEPLKEINVSYLKGSTSKYKITTSVVIDYYNTPLVDRDETTLDTMSISISEDFKEGQGVYFTKTEKYRNSTSIFLMKETDSTYKVIAKWDEETQEYVSVDPYVDINKKLRINSNWIKPFFSTPTEFKVSNFTTANASNRLYVCAKVEPKLSNPNFDGKYTYFYDARGLVRAQFYGKSNIRGGIMEQTESIELL